MFKKKSFGRVAAARSLTLLAVGMVAAAPAAFAADAENGTPGAPAASLEEIVVTATRQEQPLSKVPMSVTALSADAMSDRGIKDIQDVVRYTPGVNVDSNITNSISIRGIASTSGTSTTGIYIDDVPVQARNIRNGGDYSATDNALIKVFDLSRVEILRGPQGTLFGAGSEGGTVRYITNQPNLSRTDGHVTAETSVTVGGAPSQEIGAAFGTPLVDGKLGLRLSAYYRNDGGWIDRVDPITQQTVGPNSNYTHTTALHGSLLWQPVEWLTVTPSLIYQREVRGALSHYWPTYSNPGDDRFINGDATSHVQPDRIILPSLHMEADAGPVKIISTTSIFDRTETFGADGTAFALSIFQSYLGPYFLNPAEFPLVNNTGFRIPASLAGNRLNYTDDEIVKDSQRNFTQELRLQSSDPNARLTWTAGVFYSRIHQQSYLADQEPGVDTLFTTLFGANYGTMFGTPLNPDGSTFLGNGVNSFDQFQTFQEKELAGFGEIGFKITAALKLTAGLRVAKSDTSFYEYSDGAEVANSKNGSESDKPVTPRFNATYQIDPNNMVYATYAKGFRPGGPNPEVPEVNCPQDFAYFGINAVPNAYSADSVKSYEIGAKDLIADRVRLASSIYYIKWSNIQQTVIPPLCGAAWTQNLGEAVSKGFDLEADVALTSAIEANLSVGFTDARYSTNSFVGAASTALPLVEKGDAITTQAGQPIAPWTVALGVQYNFDISAVHSFLRADYTYSSAQKWDPAQNNPNTLQYDPYYTPLVSTDFVSLRGGVKFGNWTASLFVNNLFDKFPVEAVNHTSPAYDFSTTPKTAITVPLSIAYTVRPRTMGLSIDYKL